jgi:hypothetical protein
VFNFIISLYEIEEISKTRFSTLENITLCTGVFRNEKEVVDHLITIWKAGSLLGFEGEMPNSLN